MTRGHQAKGWAPYAPGQTVVLQHLCNEGEFVHTAAVQVRRCEARTGFDLGSYKWRVYLVRCDGTLLAVDVDHRGYDRAGRIVPPAVAEAVTS